MFRYLLILGEKLLVIFKDFRNVKVKCEKTVVDWCKEWGYFAFVYIKLYYSSVQSVSCVQTAAHQASLSITNSQSPPKLKSIELVMPSNHLILCCPLLLLPSVFPSMRVVWFSRISKLFIAPLFFLFFSVFKSIVLYHLFFYFQAFYSRDLWQWFLL